MGRRGQVAVFIGALLLFSGTAAGVALVAGVGAAQPTPTPPSRRPLAISRPQASVTPTPAPAASDASLSAAPPVAVMVDNWTEARPQSGLDRADVVYEALVEGGITRFLAIYTDSEADWIEPVRSARTQFLPLALEWGTVYLHVGAAEEAGPADAARLLREWRLRAVDEPGNESVIRRDPARQPPYNAVTDTTGARGLARTRGWGLLPTDTPWPRKAEGGASGPAASTLSFDFDRDGLNGGSFAVRWQYDAASNSYLRWQAGAPHRDGRSGQQLTAKNVIVQLAEVRPAGDRAGHVLYPAEGTGRALVLLDSRALAATWRKDSPAGRTRYLDDQGRDIPLNPGPTWIALLPTGAPLSLR